MVTYSKKFMVDVAMTNYDAHFAITYCVYHACDKLNEPAKEEMDHEKQRIRKSLEEEYDKIGKHRFRKINGITAFKIKKQLNLTLNDLRDI